ncbi:hypothetical protein, partial [Olivibacter jilunii]|uniref:hypothetical protein n=1 Tax=Olivibacter jilunii TaxID=985016 RepID=UPI003F16A3DD
LFVSPHICRLLPLDSQSPATPLLLANPSYYKAGSGLAPYSRLPCPAHHKKRETTCFPLLWQKQPFL